MHCRAPQKQELAYGGDISTHADAKAHAAGTEADVDVDVDVDDSASEASRTSLTFTGSLK